MDSLYMFQFMFVNIDKARGRDLERISADAGTKIYLHRVPGQMSKPWYSFNVSSYITPGNEMKSRSDMENVAYNCKLSYGTC